ncbi:hypothetical protein [Rhodococcus koreensis]
MRIHFGQIAVASVLAAMSASGLPFEGPTPDRDEQAELEVGEPPPVHPTSPVEVALERHRVTLQAIPGVVGIATGRTNSGEDALIVWIDDTDAAAGLPSDIEGFPLVVHHVPGGFHAQ